MGQSLQLKFLINIVKMKLLYFGLMKTTCVNICGKSFDAHKFSKIVVVSGYSEFRENKTF